MEAVLFVVMVFVQQVLVVAIMIAIITIKALYAMPNINADATYGVIVIMICFVRVVNVLHVLPITIVCLR